MPPSPAALGPALGTAEDADCTQRASVAQALETARQAGLDRTDARVLLGHVLARPRSWLIAHDDAPLAPAQAERFAQLCRQRAEGMPVAYLVGRREFHGLELMVTPAVLVPRPDTETLVDWAISLRERFGPSPRVLDLGTGSGAIALAVARAWRDAVVTATDSSTAALAVASDNAGQLGLRIDTLAGDWWQAVAEDQRFELVLSNPPYIAEQDPHLPALRHEPQMALTAGADGLSALRTIIDGAPQHLAPDGWLLLEHGWDQADAVAGLMRAAGFWAIEHRRDLAGHRRCTAGRWPATGAPLPPGAAVVE
jgi:release factor glutamine methyltransferase